MKKLLVLGMSVMLIAAMTACGEKPAETTATDTATSASPAADADASASEA